MKTEKEEMLAQAKADTEASLQKLREELTPREVVTDTQVKALQTRLEALHAAQLISDDELFVLEDIVADFVELEASTMPAMRPITLEAVHTSAGDACAPAAKLLKLVALSERLATDAAFARQARRKFV